MAKLTLNPNPKFKLKVGIPVQGQGIANVEFTFKHHKKSELTKVLEIQDDEAIDDVDYLMRFVDDWDLDDKFTKENLATLLENYIGAGQAIVRAYSKEMNGIREKN